MSTLSTPATPPAETSTSRKTWHVGTLTYTTGALAALFFWLLWGDFAWSMKERSIGSIIQLLFKKYEASDMLTGLILGSLPAALSLLIGPVISYKSDRHRGRWGRRIPFLFWTTPLAVVSMVGLAYSPNLGAHLHHSLGLTMVSQHQLTLITLAAFWTLFELSTIVVYATFNALINDVVPHNVLGRFYGLFRALSLIAGIIFNYWMLRWAETHFSLFFIAIGILYGVGFGMMCVKVKEGGYPQPELEQPGQSWVTTIKIFFQECYGDSYYIWIFAFGNIAMLAFTPINAFSLYFAKSIDMDLGMYGKCLAITYGISLCASYPIGILVDRFHPLRVGLISLVAYALVTLWGGLYALESHSFSIALILHGVMAGTYGTATAAIGQMLLPKDKFAQFSSAWGIIGCFTGMIIGPATGLFLDHSGHQYRYTFLLSSALAAVALLCGLVVYIRAKSRGALEKAEA